MRLEHECPAKVLEALVALRDLAVEDVRQVFGCVSQPMPTHSPRTLRENLRLVRPQATDVELVAMPVRPVERAQRPADGGSIELARMRVGLSTVDGRSSGQPESSRRGATCDSDVGRGSVSA